MSSIPHTPSTATRKRKPLSAARVYQAWAADVSQHGRRGAFRRTAELVGCSPEYIRQLVAKHEAEHTLNPEAFTAHELDYMPAPGERPLARPTQPVPIATHQATISTAASCDDYVKPNAEVNVIRCETDQETQLATDTEAQPAERENADVPLATFATVTPQTPALLPPVFPVAPVKRYAPRPTPAHWDVTRIREQVNPYMVLALVAAVVLVVLVQMSR